MSKPAAPRLHLIGAPLDLGASVRGASLGPAALRLTGLAQHLAELGHTVVDGGDIDPRTLPDALLPIPEGMGRHATAIGAWVRAIHDGTFAALQAGDLPILLGGDHSIAMGSASAAARHAAAAGKTLRLLWVDAHADYNSPTTSPSGNLHGMSVACLCGEPGLAPLLGDRPFTPLPPAAIHLFGLRSIDAEERRELAEDGLRCTDMRLIDEQGVGVSLQSWLAGLDPATTHLHVSLDLDALDPTLAPGVGTPVQGGLTYREAHLVMEILHESGLMRSLDIVELNPLLDDRAATARLAVDLVGSLFGRTVLARPGR
jgi:arginase